ncbi:MAG: GIY-YIG nuclease family protein [Rhodanobacter sp.]
MPHPRFASRGRTFVYVLPCRDEDILKVGFSRDPLDRLRTLHRRFFEFFDLDRGLLIDTDYLREARRIERLFITTFKEQRAPAPLVVRKAAAGHTEWFRGVSPEADALARQLCAEQGLVLHMPLRHWLRDRLHERSGWLFGWSARMLEALEYEYFNVPAEARSALGEKNLRDTLDTCAALGMDLPALVSTDVLDWYRSDDYFGTR